MKIKDVVGKINFVKRYDYQNSFLDLSAKLIRSAQLLKEVNKSDIRELSIQAKETEEKADLIVHGIYELLLCDHTRVTEEVSDIRYFVKRIDDIIDDIEEVIWRLMAWSQLGYELNEAQAYFGNFIRLIEKAIHAISVATECSSNFLKYNDTILDCIKQINEYENKGDILYRKSLLSIMKKDFREEKQRILLLEIVKRLERILDNGEDIADMLDTFRLKGGI